MNTQKRWSKRSTAAQVATRDALRGRVSRARLTSKEGPARHGGTAWDVAWSAGGNAVTGRLVLRDGAWNLYRCSVPTGRRPTYNHVGKSLVATTSTAPYTRKLSTAAGLEAMGRLVKLTGKI